MTDVPEGPAEGEPERGSRRSPRVGDSGSPVGSTLSIVLAVIAVIAGFLILRAITDDDDGGGGDAGTETTVESSTNSSIDIGGAGTTTPTTAVGGGIVTTGATVSVANASGVAGSAAAMTTALQTAGYTMGEAGNTTGGQLNLPAVYYTAGDAAAQAVATSVATQLGGVQVEAMPTPPPIDKGLGTSTVLVMVGVDTAGKTLADLAPAASATPPAGAGVSSSTNAP